MISNFLKVSTLLIIFLMLTSCEEEDNNSDPSANIDAIWDNQFLFGNTTINGQPIITNEVETTSEFIADAVCYSNLPSSPFTSVSFYVYIPRNDQTIPGFDVTDLVIFFANTSILTQEIDRQLSLVGSDIINDISYSIFLVEVSLPNDLITRDNFQQLRFDFDMRHLDVDTEQELNRDDKFIQININPC